MYFLIICYLRARDDVKQYAKFHENDVKFFAVSIFNIKSRSCCTLSESPTTSCCKFNVQPYCVREKRL